MPVHVRGRGWRCVSLECTLPYNHIISIRISVRELRFKTKFPKRIGIDQFHIIMYSRGLHLGQINSVMLK